MTIANSLVNALSGLTASSRRAEVVSSNIANASTPGYGVRQVELTSTSLNGMGSGVRIDGVNRVVDPKVIQDRRLADAMLSDSQTRANFLKRIEQVIGIPGEAGSLSDRIAAFDSALLEAASRPDSETRLGNVVTTAKALIGQIDRMSTDIQSARQAADRAIAHDVDRLNESLVQVKELNIQIAALSARQQETAGLIDERQRVIDDISTIVPVQQIARDHGHVALYTRGGVALLEGKPAEIEFTPANIITPDMQLGSSILSGLTINGVPHDTATGSSRLSGGSLIAHFSVRDELAVDAQAEIDALARDLVERFQNPAVDPSLGALDAGLFTDNGGFFDASNEEGLSQRLSLNVAADPSAGGALYRLRDGLGATAAGDIGNATLLNALHGALNQQRSAVSGGFSGRQQGFSDLGAEALSRVSTDHQNAEERVVFAATQFEAFRSIELKQGVDTDHELQELLIVEAAFAANARVIKTADEMLDILMRIG